MADDYCTPAPDAWWFERLGKTVYCGVAEIGKTVVVPVAGEAGSTVRSSVEDVSEAAPEVTENLKDALAINAAVGFAVLSLPVAAVGLDFLFNQGKVTKGTLKAVGSLF